MQMLNATILRSIGVGMVALLVALLLGFVLTGLQNPIALGAVFVIAFAWSTGGFKKVPFDRGTALPAAIIAGIVLLAFVIFLISPSYMSR